MDHAISVTREELFARVWATPMRLLCQEFLISDRGLAKVCARMEIPVPGRGYWRRIELGHKPKIVTLPPLSSKGKSSLIIRPSTQERSTPPAPAPRIEVADVLKKPHPLVARTKEVGTSRRGPMSGFLYLGGSETLNVRVTRKSFGRALRICDAIVKALEAEGMPVKISDTSKTVATFQGQQICFLLEEKCSRSVRPTKYGFNQYDFTPTGQFVLRIDDWDGDGLRRSWSDGRKQRLEDCLGEFVAVIKAIGPKKVERERQWQEERKRRELAEQRWREEQDRRKRLEREIIRWKRAKEIREYLAVLEQSCNAETALEHQEWVAWVRSFAVLMDPARLDCEKRDDVSD